MKTYSQVEGMLYSHFEKVKNRDKYKFSLERTRKRIAIIEDDLKECRFNIEVDLPGTDYSKDMITSSINNTSSMEKALIREETRLEQELVQEKKNKFTLKRKIRNIQKQIDDIESILALLPINYIEFIRLLYRDKLTYRLAGHILNCDASTVSRNKKALIMELRERL